MAMGCEIKGTNDCFIHEYSPLPGSNYGETKVSSDITISNTLKGNSIT